MIKRIYKGLARRWKAIFNKEDFQLSILEKVRLRFMKDKRDNSFKFLGKKMLFSMPPYWFAHSYKEIYEEQVYKFIPLNENPVILDCGANIGLSVIYFKKLYPGSKVIAFEPDEKIFNQLCKNVNQFGFEDVYFEKKAVWREDEELSFDTKGGMAGSLLTSEAQPQKTVTKVQATRLWKYLDTKIDFLKIDIEGAEVEVLKDCRDRLYNVNNLFVEYHCYKGDEQLLDELLVLLKKAGFRYYIRTAYETMKFPFVEKAGEYAADLQLNIFCYR